MRKVGELVLIYYMGKPSVYAQIKAIEPDVKEGWYQVELLVLTIPAQHVRWILKEEYIDGTMFTMGGIPIRLGDVEIASPDSVQDLTEKVKKNELNKDSAKNVKKHKSAKVIRLQNHKKEE